VKEKNKKWNREGQGGGPTPERKPVLPTFEKVEPRKELTKKFAVGGDVKVIALSKTISRWLKRLSEKRGSAKRAR
jgi:hypothetical protein